MCALCGELTFPGIEHLVNIANGPVHRECLLRASTGGLNHHMKRCSCYGGTEEPDPPGMTKREAAKAVLEYVLAHAV